MKKYFFFILFIMVGFSGYIFISRPGAISFDLPKIAGLGNLNLPQLTTQSQTREDKTPPYLQYISGGVLVTNEGQSYNAEINQRLRIGDEIMTSTNSKVVLYLGEQQLVQMEAGTKLKINGLPKRNRGFTDISLKGGQILVDFFEGKHPIGVKVELPNSYIITPDASFRAKVSDEKIRVAIDRKSVLVKSKESKETIALTPGMGAILDSSPFEKDRYKWVDGYNWDEKYQELAKVGVGVPNSFKAPRLSQRAREISREELRQKRPERTRSTANVQVIKREAATTPKPTQAKKKGMGDKALKVLSKIPVLGKNISESTETVGNFEEVQKDRFEALDKIE